MTVRKIYNRRPDIKKRVYDELPVTKAEKKCKTEKAIMDGVRAHRAKKYYNNPET